MPPELPAEAAHVVTRYLQLADEALPDRIQSHYLVGSIALGDFRPRTSDVDFVAVSQEPLTEEEMERLVQVHEALKSEIERPYFDGIYVARDQLARNPEEIENAPSSHEGRFQRTNGFEANPITWLIMRRYPALIRGNPITPWHDAEVVQRWTLNNLNTYWAGLTSQLEQRGSLLPVDRIPEVLGWCVPGVLRLAYTLETGDVTSKSGACRYGLQQLPEQWHPVLEAALALRIAAPSPMTISRSLLHDAAALIQHVIHEENRRVFPSP